MKRRDFFGTAVLLILSPTVIYGKEELVNYGFGVPLGDVNNTLLREEKEKILACLKWNLASKWLVYYEPDTQNLMVYFSGIPRIMKNEKLWNIRRQLYDTQRRLQG